MKQKHLQLGSVWQVIVCIIIMLMLTNCRSEPQVVDEVVEPEPVVVEPEATAVAVEPTQPPEPQNTKITSADEMAGIWLGTVAGEKGYVMYTPDGQFAVSLSEGDLTTAPRVTGEYWFENDQIHMRDLQNVGHWAACDAENVGVYEVVLSEDKMVTFQTVNDACNEGGFTRQYLFANMIQERIGNALPMAQTE